VPRFVDSDNYTINFGMQWNKFDKTQLDREKDGYSISKERFCAETSWTADSLSDNDILEVGSGAGRFSKVILETTSANLYSIDYFDAVSGNYKNNSSISYKRFQLFQASIYSMPFPDNCFDRVLCLGVLQHTPDVEKSVSALIEKAKPGGEIVVDFYPIKGWWTKLHAKYLLRPIARRLNHDLLLRLIEASVDWLMKLERTLHFVNIGALARFLSLVDVQGTIPKHLSAQETRDWVILDTFDMFSPEYDSPQRIAQVVRMFDRNGADVTFSGFVNYCGNSAAVVRGLKRQ
jgi:SAM-dependent methyltransferase